MATPMRQDQQQDVHAVYIHACIARADQLEAEGKAEEQSGIDKKRLALDQRIAAGVRLIEVQDRCKGQGVSFTTWLADNFSFTRQTAYNLMKLAGATDEERKEHRAKDRDRKKAERDSKKAPENFNTGDIMVRTGVCSSRCNTLTQHRKILLSIYGDSILTSAETYEDACIDYVANRDKTQEQQEEEHREKTKALPDSEKRKLEKIAEKERQLVRMRFNQEVEEGIAKQLASRIAHVERLREKAEAAQTKYETMAKGIKILITKDEYRFLLNTLHSDREPTKEKLDKAFIIVKKLEQYVQKD